MVDETVIEDKAQASQPRTRAAKWIGIGLGVIAAVAGGIYYLNSRHYESTDDAFMAGDVIQVSPRVAGQVLQVCVQDNQHVNSGDLIAEIDARDYQARAAEARARLEDTIAKADGAQSNLQLTSTVTRAVLTQTGAAAGAAAEQVKILQARVAEDAAAIRAAEAAMGQAEAQQAAAQAEAIRAAEDGVRYRARSSSWTAPKRWPNPPRRRSRRPARLP
jgi:membrane fusion protein (multidrug efflux system)